MNKLLILIAACTFAAAAPAFAADTAPSPAQKAQQDKMTTCNAKAEGKTGDDRKAFMKTCLSAKPEKPKSKMAMCNEKTKGMTKAEADKTRSECLKG